MKELLDVCLAVNEVAAVLNANNNPEGCNQYTGPDCGGGSGGGSKFDRKEWASKDVGARREEWAKMPVSQRDRLADASHTVVSRQTEHLSGAPPRPRTGDLRRDLSDRVRHFSDRVHPKSLEHIEKTVSDLHDDLRKAGVSDEDARELGMAAAESLVAQDMESMTRQLGDHGIAHIAGNIKTGLAVLEQVPGANTPRDRALLRVATIFHDAGYLAPPSQMFMDEGHPRWSSENYAEHVGPVVERAFGKSASREVEHIIRTHDSTEMDWKNDPVASAARVADNTALFHEDKLPPLFRHVPANVEVLKDMAAKKISVEEARDRMRKNVEDSDLQPRVKELMSRAADEVAPITAKMTLGMLGGKVSRVAWNGEGVDVYLQENKAATELNKIGDFGQRQFGKFAETYGVDPKQFTRGLDFEFKNKKGTKVLRGIYEGTVANRLLVISNALCNLDYVINSFCATGSGGGVDPSCSPKSSGLSPAASAAKDYLTHLEKHQKLRGGTKAYKESNAKRKELYARIEERVKTPAEKQQAFEEAFKEARKQTASDFPGSEHEANPESKSEQQQSKLSDETKKWVNEWTFGREGTIAGSDKLILTPPDNVSRELKDCRPDSEFVQLYRSHRVGDPAGKYESWTTNKDFAESITDSAKDLGSSSRVTITRRVHRSEILYSSDNLPDSAKSGALENEVVVIGSKKEAQRVAKLRGEEYVRGESTYGNLVPKKIASEKNLKTKTESEPDSEPKTQTTSKENKPTRSLQDVQNAIRKHGLAIHVKDGVRPDREQIVLDHVDRVMNDMEDWEKQAISANAGNRQLTVVLHDGATVKHEDGRRALGTYNSQEATIDIAAKMVNRDQVKPTTGTGSHTVTNDLRGTLYHEFGHAVSRRIATRAANAGVQPVGKDLFDSKPKSYWAKTVSKYAAKNHRELMAEAYAAWKHPGYKLGKPLPPEIVAVFEAAGVSQSKNTTTNSTVNSFCPTGEGGGVDPSCGGGKSKGVSSAVVMKAKSGDRQAMGEVIEKNQGIVHAIARKYAKPNDPTYQDLLQEGNLGLIRAVQKFKEDGAKFSTYAYHWVRSKIHHAVRSRSRISKKEGNEMKTEPESKAQKGDSLESAESSRRFAKAMDSLNDRERDLITKRHGLSGGQPQNLAEIARGYNISRERARQIEAKAMKRMREIIDATTNALCRLLSCNRRKRVLPKMVSSISE